MWVSLWSYCGGYSVMLTVRVNSKIEEEGGIFIKREPLTIKIRAQYRTQL